MLEGDVMMEKCKNKKCIKFFIVILLILIGYFSLRVYTKPKYLYSINEVFEGLGYEVKWENNTKEILVEKNNHIYYKFSQTNRPMKYIMIDNQAYINQNDLRKIKYELDDKYQNNILIPTLNNINNKDDAPIFSYISRNKFIICDYKEKKTYYIMFLASWCPHCKNILSNKDNLNLIRNDCELIIVNIDNKKSEDESKGILYNSDKELFRLFNGEYVPSVFKVEDGKIIDKYVGKEEVVGLLEKITR